jgi:site-specific DNA recombinase
MDSHWVHGRPGYRCRHGHTSAKPTTPNRPKTLYLREDRILAQITPPLEGTRTHDHATLAEPAELAHAIRAEGITIWCDPDTCTLDTDLQLIN